MRRSILAFAAAALLAAPTFCLAQTYTANETFVTYTGFPPASPGGPDSALIQANDGNFYGVYNNPTDLSSTASTIYKYTPAVPGYPALAGTVIAIHTATGSNGDTGGYSSLVQGTDGSFYGTTVSGGANGYGSVFRLTASGKYSTVYSFCSQNLCADGSTPQAPLIEGSDGNLYGMTELGGLEESQVNGSAGTIFQLTPGGKLTTLYKFCSATNCTDGSAPQGTLLQASDGNFYGVTFDGGKNASVVNSGFEAGTLFQLSPAGTLKTIYNFCTQANCSDGGNPAGTLAEYKDGSLYGEATVPITDSSLDIAFSMTTGGVITNVADFCGYDISTCPANPCNDACQASLPYLPYFPAGDGALYFSSEFGSEYYGGEVSSFTDNAIYGFCSQVSGTGCPDGMNPSGALIQGNDGAFYGTTAGGLYRILFTNASGASVTPPITLKSSATNLLVGQAVNLSWTVNNAFSDTMKRCEGFLNGTPIELVPLSGTYSYKPTAAGSYVAAITCGGVETGLARFVVTKSATPTATTLTGPATTVSGQPFTLSGTVSKQGGVLGVPAGTVTLRAAGAQLATVPVQPGGTYSFPDSGAGIPSGTFSVTATYNGDGGDSASTSAPLSIAVTRQATEIGVGAYPNPVPANQEVRLTTTVYGIASGPTGSVTFSYAGTVLATVSLSPEGSGASIAQFTASTSGLPAGTYIVKASYGGDAYDQPSSGMVSVMVQ